MRLRTRALSLLFLTLVAATALVAQTAPPIPITVTAVPRVVQVNSTFHPSDGTVSPQNDNVLFAQSRNVLLTPFRLGRWQKENY